MSAPSHSSQVPTKPVLEPVGTVGTGSREKRPTPVDNYKSPGQKKKSIHFSDMREADPARGFQQVPTFQQNERSEPTRRTPHVTATRYPLEPLATHLGITLGQIGGHQPGQHPTGMTALADRLGVAPRVLQRHRRHGLTPILADRYAIRVGAHPATIWPSWFHDIDPADDLHGVAAHNATKTHCPQGHEYDHIDAHGARR